MNRRRFSLLTTCLLLCLSVTTTSQAQPAAPARLPVAVQQELRALLRRPELQPAQVGVWVEAIGWRPLAEESKNPWTIQDYNPSARRTVLFERDPDKLFLPASNLKLLVSAAALDRLGAEFRYATPALAVAPIGPDGTLTGDLFLRGAGDPSLDYEGLRAVVQTLKESGLKRVAGGVVGDETLFPDNGPGLGWEWDDLPWYYAPEISALSLRRNRVDVRVRPGQDAGQPAQVEVSPPNGYVQIDNRALTVAQGKTATIRYERALGGSVIEVTGEIPMGGQEISQGCSVPQPALYTATVLTDLLRENGVAVRDAPRTGTSPKDARTLAILESPPLRDLIRWLNKYSDNLSAELLLRTLGLQHRGQGTVAAGRQAVATFLEKYGLDTARLNVADGSGLSRHNLVSPHLLVDVLRVMAHHPQADVFYRSLPIAGVDGTLRGRMKGTPAAGNVRAKTGTLSHVSALSGYVTTPEGHVLAVSVLVNQFVGSASSVQAFQDRVFAILADCRWH